MTAKPAISHVPEDYAAATAYLVISGNGGATAAMTFYVDAFGAEELVRVPMPDGTLSHAEIRIGGIRVMFWDAPADRPAADPGRAVEDRGILIYVPDAVAARAAGLGARITAPVADTFYGDRVGTIVDPFGHFWRIATHVEDIDEAEFSERYGEWSGAAG